MKDKFYKELFALILPMALQNLLTNIVSASDAIMLGGLSQSSLSAVSLAGQISFVNSLFLTAFMIGESAMAAQYWGRKDLEAVEGILGIAVRYAFIVSVLFFAVSFLTPQMLMGIFTTDSELVALGSKYLRTVSFSYLFLGISQIYLCIMKNSGRVARSSVYGTIPVILNFGLNAVFIFGLFGCPRMEIVGAALATVIARFVELALVLFEHGKRDVVRYRLSNILHGDRELNKDFWKYTSPVLGNEIAWGGGITMYSVIIGHLGSDAVAANSIANIAKNIIGSVGSGLGAGAGIMVGNRLGAGELEAAKRTGARVIHTAIVIGVISGVIILLINPIIMMFAGNLSGVSREYLRIMLFMCACYMLGKVVNSVLVGGIFCAGGDTRFGFFADLLNLWFVILPLSFFAAFVIKAPVLTVYFIMSLDEFTKLPFEYVHYKKYEWVKNITK